MEVAVKGRLPVHFCARGKVAPEQGGDLDQSAVRLILLLITELEGVVWFNLPFRAELTVPFQALLNLLYARIGGGLDARAAKQVVRTGLNRVLNNPPPEQTDDRALSMFLPDAGAAELELDSRAAQEISEFEFGLGVKRGSEGGSQRAICTDDLPGLFGFDQEVVTPEVEAIHIHSIRKV